jgi:hypothetical protein
VLHEPLQHDAGEGLGKERWRTGVGLTFDQHLLLEVLSEEIEAVGGVGQGRAWRFRWRMAFRAARR